MLLFQKRDLANENRLQIQRDRRNDLNYEIYNYLRSFIKGRNVMIIINFREYV